MTKHFVERTFTRNYRQLLLQYSGNVLSPKVRINTLTNLPRLSKINHKIDILNSSKSRLASNISSKLKTLSFLSVTKLLKSASFYFSYGTIHLESIVIYFREKALSPLSFSDNFTRVIPGQSLYSWVKFPFKTTRNTLRLIQNPALQLRQSFFAKIDND